MSGSRKSIYLYSNDWLNAHKLDIPEYYGYKELHILLDYLYGKEDSALVDMNDTRIVRRYDSKVYVDENVRLYYTPYRMKGIGDSFRCVFEPYRSREIHLEKEISKQTSSSGGYLNLAALLRLEAFLPYLALGDILSCRKVALSVNEAIEHIWPRFFGKSHLVWLNEMYQAEKFAIDLHNKNLYEKMQKQRRDEGELSVIKKKLKL